MSNNAEIGELFRGLEREGALAAALRDAVRLACDAGRGQAAAIVADLDFCGEARHRFAHDPRGLLAELSEFREPDDPEHECAGDDQQDPGGCATALHIPLNCGGRTVGTLVFLPSPETRADQVTARTASLCAVLATLLAAEESNATRTSSGVLGREAFRRRLTSELSRSARSAEELAMLHVTLDPSAGDPADGENTWAHVAALGETLTDRLRRSDVIGVLGPGHLAVLLPGTSRLGARIAARRIELLVRMPENLRRGSDELFAAPECHLRIYPEDGGDVDTLCRLPRLRGGTKQNALSTVNPQ